MRQVEQLNARLNSLKRMSKRALTQVGVQGYLESTPLVYWGKYQRPSMSSQYPYVFSSDILGPAESIKASRNYAWVHKLATKLEWHAQLQAQAEMPEAVETREASRWVYQLLDLLVWEILYPDYFKPVPARKAVQAIKYEAKSRENEVAADSVDQQLQLLLTAYAQLKNNRLINNALQLLDIHLSIEQRYVKQQLERAKINHPLTPRLLGVHVPKSRPRGTIYKPLMGEQNV